LLQSGVWCWLACDGIRRKRRRRRRRRGGEGGGETNQWSQLEAVGIPFSSSAFLLVS